MSLIINNNMMAANAARNLGTIYNRLSTSTQRLSSGLRINSAADDAAGLAIREMMRADIATTRQGIRNAADGISMVQTADGALAIIDEKLTRMKELAEQAATGTYTTVQRDIINSEYQAMAREIDRIANATQFNGIKLLDGSVSNQHGGRGIKIHFGLGNSEAEDYYFVNMGDARATSYTGLRVGGDAKNDIWGQGASAAGPLGGPGCCTAGFPSLSGEAGFVSGATFAYGYNWDWKEDEDAKLLSGKYTAGMWSVGSSESLQNLIDKVNLGTQSRVGVKFEADTTNAMLSGSTGAGSVMSGFAVCLGDETYYWGNKEQVEKSVDSTRSLIDAHTGASTDGAGKALTSAINNNANSMFWAMWDSAANTCYVFTKEGGEKYNSLLACERVAKGDSGSATGIATMASKVSFENLGANRVDESGTNFSLGGEFWGTMKPVLSKVDKGNEVWNVRLEGRDVGKERDLWIANIGSGSHYDFNTTGTMSASISNNQMMLLGKNAITNILGLDRESFVEIQNAADAPWAGAEVRTQSSAQESLDAITAAIIKKDKIRAELGAMQNRLENTITNLEIQAENLQASESRISDVDVATEMTEFTRNNILSQAATSMLAQANSITQLALSLLG
ncbi:MAG: flagellin [Candidatus Adiutrix sp.]